MKNVNKIVTPKIMIENMYTYAGFEVNTDSAYSKTYNISLKASPMSYSSPIKWEGILGEVPSVIENMITGVCLWDSRWKVEFYNKKKADQPGAVKVLALEIPRNEAHSYIQEGRKLKSITVPKGFGLYHTIYFSWLRESLKKLNVKHIYMQVPTLEYHHYIKEFEDQIKTPLPKLHEHIEEFGNNVCSELKNILTAANIATTFIDPMKDYGVNNPIESYTFTYEKLPLLKPKQNFFAFEDISEFKLVSGSPVKNGMFAIMNVPDPYMDKKTNEENSSTLML